MNKIKKIGRIRYLEEDGVMTSHPLFTGSEMIMIRINLRNMLCTIISDSGKLIVNNFRAKNRSHALQVMKNEAKVLGVKMFDEIRKRKKK